MLWLLGGVVVLALLLVWWLRTPVYHRRVSSQTFERFLRGLANQVSDGGLVFICHDASGAFVQFARYTEKEGTILRFAFPDAPWSKPHFDRVLADLQALGLPVKVAATGDQQVSRFLEVDLLMSEGDAISKAGKIARLAFRSMGSAEEDTYTVHYEGDLDPGASRDALITLARGRDPRIRKWALKKLRRGKA